MLHKPHDFKNHDYSFSRLTGGMSATQNTQLDTCQPYVHNGSKQICPQNKDIIMQTPNPTNPLYQAYLQHTTDPDPMPEHIFMFHYQRKHKNIKDLTQHNTEKQARAKARHDEVTKARISKKLKAHHKRMAQKKVRDAINARRIEKGLPPILFEADM